MKVVIVGAGNVGLASAEALCRKNDILVIDKDPVKTDNAKNTLPVSVLTEDGSNPRVLRGAMERVHADVVLSAVPDDPIDLFICRAAKDIDPKVKTVACIRDPDYMSEGEKCADVVVSPENITDEKIMMMATLENAVTFNRVGVSDLCISTFRIENGQDVVGRMVMDLDLPPDCTVLAVYRGEETIMAAETAELRVYDRVCVLGTAEAIKAFNAYIGIEKEAREIVILGANRSGITIAKELCESGEDYFVKIIDDDLEACMQASKALKEAIVVNGDIVDPLFLKSESVDRADVVISVSDMDERNLLACMTALRFDTRKIVTRYSTDEYEDIFRYAGIESVVGYRRVVLNEITRNVSLAIDRSAWGLIKLERPYEYFFGLDVTSKVPICGRLLGDFRLPYGVRLAAVIRGKELIFPSLDTRLEEGDRLLVYTNGADPVKLASLLGNDIPEL